MSDPLILIPARLRATRLPGKPLKDIAGKPMICRVYERAAKASRVAAAIVATDDSRIYDAVLQHGGKAVGLTGQDCHFIKARKMYLKGADDDEMIDIGQVGEIESIDPTLVQHLDREDFIPVIAPIGVDNEGESLNINADLVAGKLAETLKAEKLVLMTNTPGVLDKNGNLLTGLTAKSIDALFADDNHVEVEATYGVYQQMITAYREPDPAKGRAVMARLIRSVSSGVPAALKEVITLGRTLKKRAADILAYFDYPRTSNGPTEAINGRLEHLRGSALGFRNLTNYVARSLLETGGFRPALHPGL